MKRMWFNQPSTLQRYHEFHGVCVLYDPSASRVYFLSGGPLVSMHVDMSVSPLSEGWPDSSNPFKGITVYVECGCCGHFHRPEWRGDCREDSERFTAEDLDEKHGKNWWEYREVDSKS